jgi:hypothetical protein
MCEKERKAKEEGGKERKRKRLSETYFMCERERKAKEKGGKERKRKGRSKKKKKKGNMPSALNRVRMKNKMKKNM